MANELTSEVAGAVKSLGRRAAAGATDVQATHADRRPRPSRRSRGLAGLLESEWATVADRPAAVLRCWAQAEPALQGCHTPADVLAAVRPRPDATLAALIRLVQTLAGSEPSEDEATGGASGRATGGATGAAIGGARRAAIGGTVGDATRDWPEGLADRIVLRAMLPKMVRMARRDPDADLDDYLTHLWLRVRTYPLNRRPDRIAANLALDTLKSVKAEHARPGSAADLGVVGLPSWVTGGVLTGAPALTAVTVLRNASELGMIDLVTRRILAEVYTEGRSGSEVAERLRISPAAVRFRCSRAVRTLAGRADELAAA